MEALGHDEAGSWVTFALEEEEQIVGLYGSVNSARNLRGLGFLIWYPLRQE